MLRVVPNVPSGLASRPAEASRPWVASVLSLAIHVGVAALLLSTNSSTGASEARPKDYQVVLIPLKPKTREKIMWSPVPEIAPLHRFGPEDTPHAEIPVKQTLISESPVPDSKKQMIHEPDHPKPLPADIPTPNLIALKVDDPRPIPKPVPKIFVPPPPAPTPVRVAEPQPVAIEPPPSAVQSKIQARNDLGQFLVPVPKLKPKPFVPSAASAAKSEVAPVSQMRDVPALSARQGSVVPQSAGLQAVIVSVNPGIGPPPDGSRSAQFSKAPAAGIPSSGATTRTGAVTVPGLLAHGRPAEPMKPPGYQQAPGADRQLVKEIKVQGVNRTMSAPLRPSSRIIPMSVEAQFANRDVYAMVVPAPELPGYPGDWVMWFSEKQPNDDPRQRISAPVPFRKYATAGETAGAATSGTIQFAVLLDKGGRVSSVKIVKGKSDPAFRMRAMQELEAWDFKPALRNGEPIEVDMVVEIPLELKLSADSSK